MPGELGGYQVRPNAPHTASRGDLYRFTIRTVVVMDGDDLRARGGRSREVDPDRPRGHDLAEPVPVDRAQVEVVGGAIDEGQRLGVDLRARGHAVEVDLLERAAPVTDDAAILASDAVLVAPDPRLGVEGSARDGHEELAGDRVLAHSEGESEGRRLVDGRDAPVDRLAHQTGMVDRDEGDVLALAAVLELREVDLEEEAVPLDLAPAILGREAGARRTDVDPPVVFGDPALRVAGHGYLQLDRLGPVGRPGRDLRLRHGEGRRCLVHEGRGRNLAGRDRGLQRNLVWRELGGSGWPRGADRKIGRAHV